MNFGDILKSWEGEKSTGKLGPGPAGSNGTNPTLPPDWLDSYPPEGAKEADLSAPDSSAEADAARVHRHEAEIDLHGLTLAEAERRTDIFLRSSFEKGLQKVLIIHGKGVHSAGTPVLRDGIRRFLERHPYAGRIDVPPARYGGRGALWVAVRYRSR